MITTLDKPHLVKSRGLTALASELADARKRIEKMLKDIDALLKKAEATAHLRPRASALDQMEEVIRIGHDLRTKDGKLSANRVADLYAVSGSKLAGWLGRNRQTVNKTPDAELLQESLEFFERVARLTTILPVPQFRKWLRVPNKALDGKRPLELMASRDWQIVADLVDDMLTGQPG